MTTTIDTVREILAAAEASESKRAADMPTESDAMKMMHTARQRLIDDCNTYAKVGVSQEARRLSRRCSAMLAADAQDEWHRGRAAGIEECERMNAELAAQQVAMPQGWRVERVVDGTIAVISPNGAWHVVEDEKPDIKTGECFYRMLDAMLAAAPPLPQTERVQMTKASVDVLAERHRQISVEGWTREHDDEHTNGEMARAGAAYAAQSLAVEDAELECGPPPWWPWDRSWWKPSSRRRMLIKSAALVLAEIERIDRAIESHHGITK